MSLQVDLPSPSGGDSSHIEALFAEELGLVLEVAAEQEQEVVEAYRSVGLNIESIGEVTTPGRVEIGVAGTSCISGLHLPQILNFFTKVTTILGLYQPGKDVFCISPRGLYSHPIPFSFGQEAEYFILSK